jgi:CRISPR/Cas system-associated endoribonuclease Cas2
MATEKNKDELNERQERFCQLYAKDKEFFGNGVSTYLEVYDIDKSKKNWYKTACAAASQLLSNIKVIDRINVLLAEGGLNDANVDKQLLFLVSQYSDFKSKLGAIKEYNNLKQRITERKKIEFTDVTDEDLAKRIAEEVADLI